MADLKDAIIKARGLGLPNFDNRFILYTDASKYATRGALTQIDGQEEIPVT